MLNSPVRRSAQVRFGRHKALVSPLTIHQEPDREEEPEVSTQPVGREEESWLGKAKVSSRLIRVVSSILAVWSVWQWVVSSWEKEAGCR